MEKNFYQHIREALTEEQESGSKYAELAMHAPSVECRETLMKMARQELVHKAHLEGMLLGHDE